MEGFVVFFFNIDSVILKLSGVDRDAEMSCC